MNERLYSIDELVDILHVSRTYIIKNISGGAINVIITKGHNGGKKRLIKESEVHMLLDEMHTTIPSCDNFDCQFERWGHCLILTECLNHRPKGCPFFKSRSDEFIDKRKANPEGEE